MARAIKFKNDDYLDTSGIVHNQTNFKTLVENMKVKNLFSGRSNGNIVLNDSIMNYDFIEVIYSGNTNYLQNGISILDTRYIQTTAIQLIAWEISTTNIVFRSSTYNMIGTNMTLIDYRYGTIPNTPEKSGPYIYVLAVNGYKDN